jgi:LmbE family N-acetylglucosaminyl deacetylase
MVRQDAPNRIDAPGTDEVSWRSWPALGRLPRARLENWASVVVIAAHPDDEVLGVGGTMALLAAAGARVRLVAITDGEGSHPAADPAGLAARRVTETAAALRVLGAQRTEIIRLRRPDTGLTGCEAALAAELHALTAGFDVCLAPWPWDAHADHEAAGRAARRACPATLGYPVWMWHWAYPGDPRVPWHQALRVPLPRRIAAGKQAAIRCFASQLEDREPSGQPVLTPGVVAHFARAQEVLLP